MHADTATRAVLPMSAHLVHTRSVSFRPELCGQRGDGEPDAGDGYPTPRPSGPPGVDRRNSVASRRNAIRRMSELKGPMTSQ